MPPTSLFIFISLLTASWLYYQLAKKFNIVDKPNHRSSHSHTTVRGGGIIFPVAAILWWIIFDFQNTWMILGLILISGISLLDDMFELSRKLRFGVQFLAICFSFYDLGLFTYFPAYTWLIFFFFALGVINAINFMDGINGITGLSGLVFFGTLLVLDDYFQLFDEDLIQYILLSLSVFLLFNLRKRALMFAGDIGSISMAYMMIYFMTQWYIETESWTIILILLVYGADVFLTMVKRYQNGEKLTEPHRSHLYQLFVNQAKIPHVYIALLYAVLQALINYILFVQPSDKLPDNYLALGFLIGMAILYLIIKSQVQKSHPSTSS
ncbi:UDP-N-acetylmuramyl pentapeptide phosphotransferase/UDP-N-acetylglucosamine-1-phosphate transferase [Algoriphagus ornithinivorans]|uniref:UDP-N-acetylmuramyl pentapeptide phosphotransferase/UDP-N-acetylglucosamine-1-phosphate transferase n=1 Tax=Algoriphagus ornithinivorans TaxID=226506 RepID=A0A1I5HJY7_9BACT|nr:hypothetical protein [Algoriphagus ornithinivorans]SFO48449.1 UDP-N-acetylmuramyl pentapeptide phosphotransferase/UDP-N-acetylglucosamine-1-phosphate transferase [Algoriphagus ornithinivorans]